MIRRFRCWGTALGVMSVLLVSSCTKSKDSASGDDSRRLNLQINSEPVTLDPSRVEDGLGFRVVTNLMDGLTGFDNDGKLGLRVAETMTVSKDLKTYQFKIRKDAVWSDGVPVDASQFKYAIERARDPKTGSKLSGLLKWVHEVKAEGDQVTFVLEKPVSFFDQVLALPMTYPLRKEIVEANGGKWDPLRGKGIPTNGAYRIKSSVPDQEIVLEAVRAVPPAAPKTVVFRIVADESTGGSLFEQKKLDVLTRIPTFDQNRYEKLGFVKVVPFQATYFFSFNRKKKPFDRPEFRRAFAGAIDRAGIVKVLGTGEVPASSWIPRGQEGYFEFRDDGHGRDQAFGPDRETGKKLAYGGEIRIAFDSSARNSTVVEKVQSDLKDAYGWNVKLVNQEWKTYVRNLYADPEMIFRFGWSSPMVDPAVHLLPFTTNDPFSFTDYSNPKYDRLIEEIVSMKPSSERARKIVEAQRILVESDVIVVPIYHYVSTFALGPRVSKYGMNPLGYTRFEEVELK